MTKYQIPKYKNSNKIPKHKTILKMFVIPSTLVVMSAGIVVFAIQNSPLTLAEGLAGLVKSSDEIRTKSTNTDQKKVSTMPVGPTSPVMPVSVSSLYADPSSSAAVALRSASAPEEIRKLGVLASTPTGIWQTTGSNIDIFKTKIDEAKAQGKKPIVVLYAIPNIGCGGGGSSSLDAYTSWVRQRATILSGSGAYVIIEPDAIAMFNCLNPDQLNIRKQSLNAAIDVFDGTDVKTYVDAGHSNWVSANETASRLSTIDIAKTKGISVNVSNFQTNESSKSYATSVLAGLNNGALRAVVDSSRNGVGPPSNNQWCNALGRKVGTSSSITPDGIVDAYLWIKVPGESDGTGPSCSNGTSEGSFWLDYALGLVN